MEQAVKRAPKGSDKKRKLRAKASKESGYEDESEDESLMEEWESDAKRSAMKTI